MTRTQRIKRIADLADMTRRIASQRVSGSRQRHDTNLRKLADFRGYLQEYTNALKQSGNAMTAADACTLRSFIVQLERTISALETHTQRSGQECTRELDAWKKESHRANALLEVLARTHRADSNEVEGRLQRELDDSRRPRSDD